MKLFRLGVLLNMAQLEGNAIVKEEEQFIDYKRIASSEEFKQLLSQKKRFIVSYTIFYMAYSLLLPLLAFYTDILNHPVIGDITWAWIYGVSMTAMSLWVCRMYIKKAAQFDEAAKEILEKEGL
ncbi:membrane protein [Peribacillus asahii]|uniref:Membrane protein n=2 Tax=Peribacillus asahii TaxID=228899 RepID=A0A3T0KLZ0_9BACI|nr:DUF485 domain-containing protein [Peribacillus asahii]AZV41410.1 membrane protein [Peribacillus asahii]